MARPTIASAVAGSIVAAAVDGPVPALGDGAHDWSEADGGASLAAASDAAGDPLGTVLGPPDGPGDRLGSTLGDGLREACGLEPGDADGLGTTAVVKWAQRYCRGVSPEAWIFAASARPTYRKCHDS